VHTDIDVNAPVKTSTTVGTCKRTRVVARDQGCIGDS